MAFKWMIMKTGERIPAAGLKNMANLGQSGHLLSISGSYLVYKISRSDPGQSRELSMLEGVCGSVSPDFPQEILKD